MAQTERSNSRIDAEAFELTAEQQARFNRFYRDDFDFVYRNLQRLGVPPGQVDDALQDVYLVVLRRLDDFREGTHPRAWLFAILLRVAGDHRRSQRRRREASSLADERLVATEPSPFELTARDEARRILHAFLAGLPEQRRAVFVMSELEQMTVPEIASALSANVNTVYTWLRTARAELVRALRIAKHGELS